MRNLGVLLLLFIVFLVAFLLLLLPLALLDENAGETFAARLLANAFQAFVTPLIFIAVVLMYYDIRARKEAYDAAALSEDLRR